jgi:transcriptional regulator with XRE-family HTH domain
MTTPNTSGSGRPRPNLRRARERRGWSQTDAAQHIYLRGIELGFHERDLGVNMMQVSRWERGLIDPGPIYTTVMCNLYELLADRLDLPPRVLQLGRERRDVSATAPAQRPGEAARNADSGPVDSRLLDDLSTLTHSYGGLRDIVSPATLLRPVADHLDVLLRTVPQASSSADAVRVQVAAAQTAIIAGWLTFNVGRPGEALAHWMLAHDLAVEAGSGDLTAYALACRSRLHSPVHRGDQAAAPANALALLNRAVVVAATSTDVALRSWLLVNRAEQHAASGDAEACHRDLDRAVLVIDGPGTRDDVLWAHWSPARIDTCRGNCARLLHRPVEAIGVLESLLGRLDSRIIPARTLPLADLAVAYAERGEIERACGLLTGAFTAADEAGYPEGTGRVLHVRSTALAGYEDVPAVRHLDELLQPAG